MDCVIGAKLGGTAVAALAVAALAGCGATPASHSDRAVASRALDAATRSALATSFRANLTGSVRLSLTGVSGLPSSSLKQLTQLQQQLNSSTVAGSVEFQSPTAFATTYRFSPLLPAVVDVIEVGGVEYASDNGTSWHLVPAASSAKKPASLSGSLPQPLRSLAQLAGGATAVSHLPATVVDGVSVDHLQARISGAGLDQILTKGLGAGPAGRSGAELQALAPLLNFGPATIDSYISKATKRPVQESVRGAMSFNLAALGLLGSAAIPSAKGSLALRFDLTVTFSGYGSQFAITKPSDVVPGPLPTRTPPALSSLF
jgi:hypothetical protein